MQTAAHARATLTPAERRVYNRLADQMSYYHGMLRQSWDLVYDGTAPASGRAAKKQPSSRELIAAGLHFCEHLQLHHDIEEAHWFPVLARRMPGFDHKGFAKEQHRQMHRGLDRLRPYLEECRRGARDLRRDEVRDIMDGFKDVLWTHLDAEVEELGADNMQKYWSLDEMRTLMVH